MAEEKKRSSWKTALTVITFVALIALGYFARKQVVETFLNFGKVNAVVLLLMFVGQYINYHSYTKMYQRLFEILGEKIQYKKMVSIILELNFVNNIFPSGGVSSFSYFGLRMKSEGVTTGKSTLIQMMRFILTFVSFQLLLFLGLLFLSIGGSANRLALLVAGSLATLLFVGTLGVAFVVGSKQRINAFFGYLTKIINRLIHV
ncbi:MAG: lysylphosphatidylglycerol synthase domain-containing protein, partial [bacterium]|nr:lysylphosphatidylglycerol synthase domain-containing protein [bacterium]